MKVAMCEVCNRRKHEKLCDYATYAGFVSSVDFKHLTSTCDKKMCKQCATKLWDDCDICPEHVEVVRARLLKEETP